MRAEGQLEQPQLWKHKKHRQLGAVLPTHGKLECVDDFTGAVHKLATKAIVERCQGHCEGM